MSRRAYGLPPGVRAFIVMEDAVTLVAWIMQFWDEAPRTVYHRCALWTADLVHYHIIGHTLVAGAYLAIPFGLIWALRRYRREVDGLGLPGISLGLILAVFILSCGLSHALSVVTFGVPYLWLEGHILAVTAIVSWLFALLLPPMVRRELAARRLAEEAAGALNRELATLNRELAAANANLEATNAALSRSNADLEQFAYAASHDLQEPLRTLANFPRLIRGRYEGLIDEKADYWLRLLDEAARRMQIMVDDLLGYCRLAKREEAAVAFPLAAVFADAIANLDAAIEAAGARIEIIGTLPVLLGVRSQWLRLVQNLLSNAIKYHHADRSPVVAIAAIDGLLRVADNGIGIDAMWHDRIFEMFARVGVHREKGSGLGLAYVRRVVEQHGGRARVVSTYGHGATFLIDLPVVAGDDLPEDGG